MTHPCVSELLAVNQRHDTVRVWSLLMSIIGDVAAPEAGEIPLSTLLTLTRHLGLEDGTVRVALSRLTRDDWLHRRRSGRHSHYRLSSVREAEFTAASRRIYALSPPLWQGAWCLALAPPEWPHDADALPRNDDTTDLPDGHCIDTRRGLWLLSATSESLRDALGDQGWLLLEPLQQSAPAWLTTTLIPRRLTEELAALLDTLAAIERHPPPVGLDALACRCLLIHAWRRLALRIPCLPSTLLPGDWPEPACREAVAAYWQRWHSASEAWLADHGAPAGRQCGDAIGQSRLRWHMPEQSGS